MESNNIIEASNKKIIKNRSTKKDLYKKEQEVILNKINIILNINKDNNTIYLCDIENDQNKKKLIFDLLDEIKKVFKTGSWGFFKKEICKENHFLLCKTIYKEMGYQIITKPIDITRNNEKIRTTKYTIGKITIEL